MGQQQATARDAIAFTVEVLRAVADGKLTATEALDLVDEARRLFDSNGQLTGAFVEFVADLIHRTPEELEARAAQLVDEGRFERAARLREKAAARRGRR
jgi:hypothetical protein